MARTATGKAAAAGDKEIPGVLPEVVDHPDITKLIKEIKRKRAEFQRIGGEIQKDKARLIDKMRDKLTQGEDGRITYVTKHFKVEVKPGKEAVSIVDLSDEEANAGA